MKADRIDWSDELRFGVVRLDEAHRELIDLYNRIAWACENPAAGSCIRERIRSFLIYAQQHFEDEEGYMREIRYPAYVEHKADHVRLLQDAEDFIENLDSALKADEGPAIVAYFKYWLSRHTQRWDTGLKALARADGTRPAR